MGIWAPDVHRISVGHALLNLAVAFSTLGGILTVASYMAPKSPVVHSDIQSLLGGLDRATNLPVKLTWISTCCFDAQVPREFPYDGLSRELGGEGQGVSGNAHIEHT